MVSRTPTAEPLQPQLATDQVFRSSSDDAQTSEEWSSNRRKFMAVNNGKEPGAAKGAGLVGVDFCQRPGASDGATDAGG
jgi:hypothetical protein